MDNELIERAKQWQWEEKAGVPWSRTANQAIELVPALCDALEAAQAENARLREALESLRVKEHYDCEDGWYSCPKVPNYYGSGDEGKCYCGMDRINAIIDAALEPRP